jgi:hypothetical protein
MFSVITNIYSKKTKGPTLMDLFTATGKLKKFFWQLQMFDIYTTGDTAHIDTKFKFLPPPVVHTPNISSCKNTFSFPMAVNNSMKVGPSVFCYKCL